MCLDLPGIPFSADRMMYRPFGIFLEILERLRFRVRLYDMNVDIDVLTDDGLSEDGGSRGV
jgi:hypothetical protein